ncbi:MAG: hypothetical protein M3299_06510 [Thermoproteota archaeon]|nr:hypothetical protein [Thermoproteota archaeon]
MAIYSSSNSSNNNSNSSAEPRNKPPKRGQQTDGKAPTCEGEDVNHETDFDRAIKGVCVLSVGSSHLSPKDGQRRFEFPKDSIS